MRLQTQVMLTAIGFSLNAIAPSVAQIYPARPIHIVVPAAAGGANDVLARAIGQRLSEAWNTQVIVENRPGANAQIGAAHVASSPNDGYTLLADNQATFVINPHLYSKLSYDPARDFTPVSGLGLINQTLVVHPSVPARNVAELIALAKVRPGELTYGTYGIGSIAHLNTKLFENMAGVTLTPVHYKGGSQALTDLIGGHINMLLIGTGLMVQPWKAGQLRPLGVGSQKRLAEFPDLPTLAETVAGFDAPSWFGLFAPSGTPQEIVNVLNRQIQRILIDSSFQEKILAPNFYAPIIGSSDEFAAYVKSEDLKWGKLVRDSNITVE